MIGVHQCSPSLTGAGAANSEGCQWIAKNSQVWNTSIKNIKVLVANATLLDSYFTYITILMMVFCGAHTVLSSRYNILLVVLLDGCRLDVD
jgi:hypothetical protein